MSCPYSGEAVMASTFEWRTAGSYLKHNGRNTFRREDGVSAAHLSFRDETGSPWVGTVG
jgi:hypothetical protein